MRVREGEKGEKEEKDMRDRRRQSSERECEREDNNSNKKKDTYDCIS